MYRRNLSAYTGISEANPKLNIARCSSLAELDEAAELGRPDPHRKELFRSRLQDGCACFVARVGQTLVGYDWIRLRPGIDDGDMVALGKTEVFTFDAYVAEDWRGARIHRAMGAAMLMFAKEQGYTTAYTKVGIFNRRSQKSTRRNGWTSSGCVLRVSRGRGWPVLTLYGSSHPLYRSFEAPALEIGLLSSSSLSYQIFQTVLFEVHQTAQVITYLRRHPALLAAIAGKEIPQGYAAQTLAPDRLERGK